MKVWIQGRGKTATNGKKIQKSLKIRPDCRKLFAKTLVIYIVDIKRSDLNS